MVILCCGLCGRCVGVVLGCIVLLLSGMSHTSINATSPPPPSSSSQPPSHDASVDVDASIDGDIDDLCVSANRLERKMGKTLVLKGITLSLAKGNIYGLLGPSGCG